MGSGDFDPGGGKKPPTYANSVKVNKKKFEKLNRNVLEIVLEKNVNNYVSLNGDLVAKICEVVGIKPGDQTEGYQVHYRGSLITVSVWAKQAIGLEKLVTEESRQVVDTDLVITQVRPAVRREVLVLITGLPFNTPYNQVTHHLECFGAKVAGKEPIYGVL